MRRAATIVAIVIACGCAAKKTPDPPRPGRYVEQLEADLREAARRFADRRLTGRQYLALTVDRAGKARRFKDDPQWRAAAAGPDRDTDGVPDPYDRCPTPPFQPTNEHGCPVPECDPRDPSCAGPAAEDDGRTRGLLDSTYFLFSPACDGSPPPQSVEPLEWGRGPQTPTSTHGFNLAVTEVTNQTLGCPLSYEMEFRVEWQAPPGQPRVRYMNVLFRADEDLKAGDARRAVFGIPVGEEHSVSPGRNTLRQSLLLFVDVMWRVRAVNGAQAASPWSAYRTQGPAAAGVEG